MIALLLALAMGGSEPTEGRLSVAAAVPDGAAQTASPSATAEADAAARASSYYEFLLGLHNESEGDLDGAVAAYQRAARLDPASADIPVMLASLYLRMNRAEDAVAAGQAALAVDADNADAHRVLGTVYASMAQADDRGRAGDSLSRAISHLERASLDDDPGAELMLARLYLRAGEPTKAIPLLSELLEREPQYTETIGLLVQAYSAMGREREAVQLLEQLAPEQPQFYRVLGELYERTERWPEAAAAYEKAASASPRSVDVKLRWATALLNQSGDAPALTARGVLETLVRERPGESRALYLLAIAQRRLRDLPAAEATARKLMDADPGSLRGPYLLAQIFEDRNEYRRVIEVLEPLATRARGTAGSSAQQDGARLLLHLGFAYEQAGDSTKAVGALEEADKLSPDASIAFQIGATYERQKRYDEAETAFRTALARDPAHAPTLNYLGYMLAEQGERLEESVQYIERALAVEPDNPSYLDSLGWAYFKLDALDRAEPPLRRASEELQRNSVVQDHWGDLLFRLGRYAEAIVAWERSLAGDGESIERSTIEQKIRSAREKAK